ncbi:hypothetical protein GQ607_007546 [Colletotrichum asianum]|uniref:Uncharacterized protein n=1 Tax=Colletotrichum asianum TaxID=702518 RepID=A0A8H3WDX3_9PEZI|nr:hypothetical protein GQ607_007546 [Colletotrichum asianum]
MLLLLLLLLCNCMSCAIIRPYLGLELLAPVLAFFLFFFIFILFINGASLGLAVDWVQGGT